MPFTKVLVANRGEIAVRIMQTCAEMGIATVAVFSDADKDALHVLRADESVHIGPAPAAQSYLNIERILDAARKTGAEAIHPGYGFLSENPDFAARVIDAGAGFIGPSPRWLEAMGHKTQARALMAAHGMPMGASSGILSDSWEEQLAAARAVGFPVLVKPATGGGGIGMLPANSEEELAAALERAASLSKRSFGNAELYLERLMQKPRHIEFQVLADRHGAVRHLFERDCSVQRRHQKVIEESPAPGIDRRAIAETAERITGILAALGYDNIGTVETLYDPAAGFAFLEMNTRLQVEHAVTEEVTGIDLVQAQIRLAAGERLDQVLPAEVAPQGHAIEVRVYAEDPKRFLPSPGPLQVFRPPQGEGIRIETGYAEGNTVTPFYDPMLAKVIARGATRQQAIARMREALDMFAIEGVKTNIAFARQVLDDEAFRGGAIHTGLTADVLARRQH